MTPVDTAVEELVRKETGADEIVGAEVVQSLWSGYGSLLRLNVRGGQHRSVIVKHVRWPDSVAHPRGWNSSASHERKHRSYQVETHWYRAWATRCGVGCRVPLCLGAREEAEGVTLLLEDLDAQGYDLRLFSVRERELKGCLRWLAEFHAEFLGENPSGLWPVGTYWHLATRQEELERLPEGPLKHRAAAIDERLTGCRFHTIVHGDAKLANFCFSSNRDEVAAVDFQYVGGGCGMKDLAYFVSSCLDEDASEENEAWVLDYYFDRLRHGLHSRNRDVEFSALEKEWRSLYPVAWTDFYRFLQGWSPGHWKINSYSNRLAKQVLAELRGSA